MSKKLGAVVGARKNAFSGREYAPSPTSVVWVAKQPSRRGLLVSQSSKPRLFEDSDPSMKVSSKKLRRRSTSDLAAESADDDDSVSSHSSSDSEADMSIRRSFLKKASAKAVRYVKGKSRKAEAHTGSDAPIARSTKAGTLKKDLRTTLW
jgi:hypothetical protein